MKQLPITVFAMLAALAAIPMAAQAESWNVTITYSYNSNFAIGKLKESPVLFASALAYLEKHGG